MSLKPFLVPTTGAPIPGPDGDLPIEGDYVHLDSFWRRRLADQEVTVGQPPKAAEATPDATSPADKAAKTK
ncbi:DUF2635 domain-containing protein [Ancylobacter defluvii]|uniref:DUF2635 domain-containing protein n=1 Tax=Ancylobacter defluvii TaxID=1282440 RepID=A0A9W6K2E4_9HYPH|nr:DUF2635 domain-containing protein [Ancylobacter defluvii]MBS7586407.1 hypothetical protein [Ancylobacter defluvii]GLK85688.1 hypothetical protein GCM10017653_37580 [Ancylobacter defluvii]